MRTQKFYVENSFYFLNDFVHMSAIHILLVHDSVVEAVAVLSNYQMFANHLFLQIVYKNTKQTFLFQHFRPFQNCETEIQACNW